MRVALALLLLLAPSLASDPSIESRFPTGANAYLEIQGLTGKVGAFLDSPIGKTIQDHPALKRFLFSEKGRGIMFGELMLRGATGMGYMDLLDAVAGRKLAIAFYGETPLAMARMDAATAERIVQGIETLTSKTRIAVEVPGEGRPALWRLNNSFAFFDGDYLVAGRDRGQVNAVRTGTAEGLDFSHARSQVASDALLFAVADLRPYHGKLKGEGKPRDFGQAIILGAFPHYLPEAPWAALSVKTEESEGRWKIQAQGHLPIPDQPSEAVEAAHCGTLGPLPFQLPESTVGLVRMRRDLNALWAHKDLLIAERGIPKLVEFETNFANLTAGMSWVEEFLPRIGDELTILAIRPEFAEGAATPAVHFPQGALVWPLEKATDIATRLEVAFNSIISFVNLQAGQMGGSALLLQPETYKGTRILTARHLAPSEAEMANRKSLPPRYNLAPATAIVGSHLVIASSDTIVKRIVDGYGRPEPAPRGVNAGFWIRTRNARELLAENREPLIASTMIKEGLDRKAAEERIDLLLSMSRYVRTFELTSHESRAAVGLRLRIEIASPEG
jgi:hypothetical protein